MKKLRKNIIYSVIGQFIIMVLGFASVKYIYGGIGPDALGLIAFAALINLLLSDALQYGIATATVREISANFYHDRIYVSSYIRTATTIYWTVYFSIVIIIWICVPYFVDHWIVLESTDRETATHVMRVLFVTSFSALPKGLYVSLLRGIEQMGVISLIDVLTVALQHTGTILFILLDLDLYSIISWLGFCYIFRLVIYICVCAHFFKKTVLLPGFELYVIKRNYLFTSRLMFSTIIKSLLLQLDKISISKFLPIADLGYYVFLLSGLSKSRLLTGPIPQSAYPVLSRFFEEKNREDMLCLYNKLQDILTFMTIPLFALFILFCKPALTLIFDSTVALHLVPSAIILCLALYVNTIATMPYIYALAVGNSGISAKQNLIDLISYLPLCVFLHGNLGWPGLVFLFCFYIQCNCYMLLADHIRNA